MSTKVEPTTWKECEELASSDDFESVSVAQIAWALGIKCPDEDKLREELSRAKTQAERWNIFEKATDGSRLENDVLSEILDHSDNLAECCDILETSTNDWEGLCDKVIGKILDLNPTAECLHRILELEISDKNFHIVLSHLFKKLKSKRERWQFIEKYNAVMAEPLFTTVRAHLLLTAESQQERDDLFCMGQSGDPYELEIIRAMVKNQ